MPPLVTGVVLGGIGFVCMIMHRSRWELALGQPIMRRTITAFTRPVPAGDQVSLRWEDYWSAPV